MNKNAMDLNNSTLLPGNHWSTKQTEIINKFIESNNAAREDVKGLFSQEKHGAKEFIGFILGFRRLIFENFGEHFSAKQVYEMQAFLDSVNWQQLIDAWSIKATQQ